MTGDPFRHTVVTAHAELSLDDLAALLVAASHYRPAEPDDATELAADLWRGLAAYDSRAAQAAFARLQQTGTPAATIRVAALLTPERAP